MRYYRRTRRGGFVAGPAVTTVGVLGYSVFVLPFVLLASVARFFVNGIADMLSVAATVMAWMQRRRAARAVSQPVSPRMYHSDRR
jgi:hypothetical protein